MSDRHRAIIRYLGIELYRERRRADEEVKAADGARDEPDTRPHDEGSRTTRSRDEAAANGSTDQ